MPLSGGLRSVAFCQASSRAEAARGCATTGAAFVSGQSGGCVPDRHGWHAGSQPCEMPATTHASSFVCPTDVRGKSTRITTALRTVKIERINVAPILVYVIGLVTMLALSAAYNLWPVSPVKWVLRRFDHTAIYLLIRSRHRRLVERYRRPDKDRPLQISVWCPHCSTRHKIR